MDMTEDNNQLLQQFFSEAAQQTIADDGFTERVMQRLPSRINWFVRAWNALCIGVAVVLFVVFDGWHLLSTHVMGLLQGMAATSTSQLMLTVGTVVFGLLFVGVGEVLSSESVRRTWLS
jgi:hypothetical protein